MVTRTLRSRMLPLASEDMADKLRGVLAEYIYFYTYLACDSPRGGQPHFQRNKERHRVLSESIGRSSELGVLSGYK